MGCRILTVHAGGTPTAVSSGGGKVNTLCLLLSQRCLNVVRVGGRSRAVVLTHTLWVIFSLMHTYSVIAKGGKLKIEFVHIKTESLL